MKEEWPFENKYINGIVQEIKESNQFENSVEKAYYLYLKLGKIYKYRVDFKYRNHNTEEELNKKVAIYNEETSEKGEATCNRINSMYCKSLNELGIKAECNFIKISGGIIHIDVQFQDDYGFWYYADLTDDLMHIQTGMKTRSFGISLQQLKEKGKRARLIIHIILKRCKMKIGQVFQKNL